MGVGPVFFKRREENDRYTKLKEDISRELMTTLQKKGINISRVHIDMNPDNVNVSVCINNDSTLGAILGD